MCVGGWGGGVGVGEGMVGWLKYQPSPPPNINFKIRASLELVCMLRVVFRVMVRLLLAVQWKVMGRHIS